MRKVVGLAVLLHSWSRPVLCNTCLRVPAFESTGRFTRIQRAARETYTAGCQSAV